MRISTHSIGGSPVGLAALCADSDIANGSPVDTLGNYFATRYEAA
jgi:hypothetical protein